MEEALKSSAAFSLLFPPAICLRLVSARLLQVLTTSCKMHTKDAHGWQNQFPLTPDCTYLLSHRPSFSTWFHRDGPPPSVLAILSLFAALVGVSQFARLSFAFETVGRYRRHPSKTKILRLRYASVFSASHTISPRRPLWVLAQRLNTERRLFASHIQSTQKPSPRPLARCPSHYYGVCDLTSRPNG